MWGNSVYTTDLGQPSSKPKQPSTIQIPQSDTQISIEAPDLIATTKGTTWGRGIPTITGGSQPASEQTRAKQPSSKPKQPSTIQIPQSDTQISIEAPDLIATTKGTTWGRGIPTITGGSQPASEQTRAKQPSSKPKVNPVQATTSRYTMGNQVQGGDFGIHRGLQRLFNYLGDVWNSRKSEAKPLTLSPGHTTKFQQGGTMNNQQELQKAFVAYLIQDAQSQGVQIQSEQDLQAYAEQLGEDGIKAKYQEFMQKMQGGVMARLGAKLEYYKKLKGVCPEGEELVYFKQGGRICKACQKAQKGTKVTKKANEVDKFKAGRAQYKKDMKSARDEASRDSI